MRDTGTDRDAIALVEAAASARPMTVLVVEGDESVASSVRTMLEAAGCLVFTAVDVHDAASILMDHRFDAIVSDMHMLAASDVDLLVVVRAHDRDVPVILTSGAPTTESTGQTLPPAPKHRLEIASLGPMQYLLTPTPSILVDAVQRAARLRRIAGAEAVTLTSAGGARGGGAGLKARFGRALETMWIAFQPVVDPARQTVVGHAAYLRCDEPSLARSVDLFVAAERLGRLGEVSRRARALTAASFREAPADAVLFVDARSRDLLDPALCDPGSPLVELADRVVLELGEHVVLGAAMDLPARVHTLRRNGFRVAVRLGAQAGLASFAALEPEIVKLDASLVRGVHQSMIRQRIIESLATLCTNMGIRLVAEGVEAGDERDCLCGLGCELLQGDLFAKPGPAFPRVDAQTLRADAWSVSQFLTAFGGAPSGRWSKTEGDTRGSRAQRARGRR
jgi:EAL domain-containing protein (putative c-di-GMP-specific phosphodiesterase class I)/CheY-like chemotaxis protein